jgi:hypothetical protein
MVVQYTDLREGLFIYPWILPSTAALQIFVSVPESRRPPDISRDARSSEANTQQRYVPRRSVI